MNEVYVTGTIDRIIFENPSNFYKILLLEIEETDAGYDDYEIIVTGTIADVIEGEDYRFYGNLVTHPKYGQQLQVRVTNAASPLLPDLSNISPVTISRELDAKRLKKSLSSMAKIPLIRFWLNLKN